MFDHLYNAVVLASFLTQALVIGLLFFRRTWRTLPIFCAYCIWNVLSNLVLIAVAHQAPSSYYHAVLVDSVLDAAITFSVLVELAWSVLRPIRASLPRSALVLVAILILVAGAIIWPFTALPRVTDTTRLGFLIAQLLQTTTILRILLFLVISGGSQLLSIGWRDRELQVATGLGVYSIVDLTVAVIQTHLTTASQYNHLELASGVGFLACLLYWSFSFAQQEAERRAFTPQMQHFLLAVAGAARSARVGMEDSRGSKPKKPDGK